MEAVNLPKVGGELRALAARGFVVTGASQAYRIVIGFISNVMLIRILAPSDFGLIAMVSSCLAFISLIQNLGLNQATIQREHISQRQMSALFWISVGFSALLAVVFALLAPLIASFFNEPRVVTLVLAFATLILVTGFQSQHIAFLNRHLRFQSLALIEVATITANAVVSVLLAWLTESYWALFAGSAASTFVRVFAAWISSGWKPGWPSFEGQFREIFLFGSGISGFNIVNYFARNADNLLIGRFYGSEQLGYYDRAYKLLLLPIQQVQSPLSRVMLPLLSRLNDQPDRYRTAYTECISLILLVTHPGLLFAAIFAKPIFLFLFGPHWLPAAPIFTWLGAAGLSHCINSPTGWLFLSQGRSGEYFKLGLYNAITVLLSFAIGLPWGPVGVAAVYAISEYACRVPLVSAMAGRSGPVTTRNIYQTVIPHWIAILLTGGILLVIYGTVQEITVLHCAFLFILAYLIYFVTILFFPSKRVILSKGMNTLLSDLILKRKAA